MAREPVGPGLERFGTGYSWRSKALVNFKTTGQMRRIVAGERVSVVSGRGKLFGCFVEIPLAARFDGTPEAAVCGIWKEGYKCFMYLPPLAANRCAQQIVQRSLFGRQEQAGCHRHLWQAAFLQRCDDAGQIGVVGVPDESSAGQREHRIIVLGNAIKPG